MAHGDDDGDADGGNDDGDDGDCCEDGDDLAEDVSSHFVYNASRHRRRHRRHKYTPSRPSTG